MNHRSQSARMVAQGLILALLLPLLVASPPLTQAQTACATSKFAHADGIPGWLEDCGKVDLQGSPEQIARRALQAQTARLGLKAIGQDLSLLAIKTSPAATSVRFRQSYKGVPVYLGQVLVQYGQDGTIQLINNQTLSHLAIDVNPTIDRASAEATARSHVAGSNQLRAPTSHELMIYSQGKVPVLAWHIVLHTQNPPGDWHVMISADSGAVVGQWDEIWNAGGSGQGYVPNAVQQTGDTTLRDTNDAASPALNDARVSVVLQNLDAATNQLKGSYVDLTGTGVQGCNLPYTPGQANEPSRVYSYTRDDDRFEELSVYSAIDGVQSWFQALGFTNVNNRAIPVNAHCITEDNSYYSDSDRALHFGDGGVDDAEDSDVVIHEYGHAVQADQVAGWGPGSDTEQRAMGEGFGDFLAGMYYLDKGAPSYLATYKYCIAEWDATGYNPVASGNAGSGCLRWINGRNEVTGTDIGTYSGTPTEEHDDGRYWSAALTCMYEGMGANTTARDSIMKLVLLQHASLLPDSSNQAFEKAVQALRLADISLFGGANQQTIINCAVARNLIQAPALFAPTITTPTVGSQFGLSQAVTINWSSIGAPATATYQIEYAVCSTAIFSDDAESGINGWTTSHVGGALDWAQVTTQAQSPTHSWFAADEASTNDQYLVSPSIQLPAAQELRFWHWYDLEDGFDGGVVEISTDNGANWSDLGPQLTSNGYSGTIGGASITPLAGRSAFTGDSGGWIETHANLSSFAGQTINLRFRQADDESEAATGWWIDDIEVGTIPVWSPIATTAAGTTSLSWIPPATPATYCLRIRAQAAGYTTSDYSAVRSFTLLGSNTAPTISTISDRAVFRGAPIPASSFTIGDDQTAPDSLIVTGSSSNQALVPNAGIVFSGSAANRTVTLTPTAGASGVTTITITVSDGSLSTSTSYRLTVKQLEIYLPLIQRP